MIDHSGLCPALLLTFFFPSGAAELVHFIGEKHPFQTAIKPIVWRRDADGLLGDRQNL